MTSHRYHAKEDDMKLINIVESVLVEDPKCKFDSWRYFFSVLRKTGLKVWVDYSQLHSLPSPESILKVRREILHTIKGKAIRGKFVPEEGVSYESPVNN